MSGEKSGGRGRGDDRLSGYHAKRDFGRTGEPRGADGASSGDGGSPVFVVQIHDASTTHFDFRLEADGVLKSWSVPKGPAPDPAEKRLAVPTEDHPLEYRGFEGVIPEGDYGAGTVIIWDEGTYEPLESAKKHTKGQSFAQRLEDGHVSFRLHGAKLRGDWALTRIRDPRDDREAWLLVKEDDGTAKGSAPDPARARSARSGRTLKQVREERGEQQREGSS